MSYVFSDEWHRERDRLAGVEAATDQITIDLLRRIGVTAGWRCAEVGAGAGSIATWLAEQGGTVVATDLDTRFLAALTSPNLVVLQHDLAVDDPPGEPFDLVHARLVVEHVTDPAAAIKRLVGWLRPGGWLVIEDVDWTTRFPISPAAEFDQALAAALQAATAAVGYDPSFGRRLPALLSGSGLTDIDAQVRAHLIRGASPEVEVLKLTVERLIPAITAAGLINAATAARALAQCADPAFATMPPSMISAWGRASTGEAICVD
jgi:SAM-dependent methyltransferase